MISAIVVYNDRDVLDAMLLRSLAVQRATHEVIAIDNTAQQFASAAAALNEGARRARGDLLLFAHQDVAFDDPTWLDRAAGLIDALPDVGIAGVAGALASDDDAGRIIVSNIEDSTPPQRAGHRALAATEAIETVDECAFFVPRSVFERYPFDERTCTGWHLYAVDHALTVRSAGLRAYVLPLSLYHRSGGARVRVLGMDTYERAYFRTLSRVLAKHRREYARVPTTCGTWSTRRGLLLQRFPPAAMTRALASWLRGHVRQR